jgi:ubiquinone biosynthesis protein Coq4
MKIRNKFIEFMAHKVYFPLIKLVYQPEYSAIGNEVLAHCPQNSLGFYALQFLRDRQIDFFKGYEVHDLKHVLLGFDTDVRGEIMMQYFELGNGNRSLVVWIVIIFGTLLVPEYIKIYFQAYKKGRQSKSLNSVFLEHELNTSLALLRQRLHLLTP